MPESALKLVSTIPGLSQIQTLSDGKQSWVYTAFAQGRKVVVKLQKEISVGQSVSAAHLFYREAAFLACLNHPSLPKVLDVGQVEGRVYLIEEFVEGTPLSELLRQTGKMKAGRVLELARKILEALRHVHSYSLVHRDLKTQNILILEREKVCLIDFGLVTRSDREKSNSEIAGNFVYGSPEQLGGLDVGVDGRSDLYSLGIILFECLVGRPPYQSNSVSELIRMHTQAQRPPLHSMDPQIPLSVEAFVHALIAKDPDDRYQSASAAIEDLSRIHEIEKHLSEAPGTKSLETHLTRKLIEPLQFSLHGRQNEILHLRRLWESSTLGHLRSVLISGPSGFGKTSLVYSLRPEIQKSGGKVLVSKSPQVKNPPPLGSFKQIFDSLLAQMNGEEKARFAYEFKQDAGILSSLSRPLKELFATLDYALDVQNVSPELYHRNLVRILKKLPDFLGTTLLLMDDIQWMDASSQLVLKNLLAEEADSKLMVAATFRDDNLEVGLPLIETQSNFRFDLHLQLQALSFEQSSSLIRGLLGGKRVETNLCQVLHQRAAGNPFAIVQFTRAILDSGALLPNWGSWVFRQEQSISLDLPKTVVDLIVARIQKLNLETQKFFQAAAIWGNLFSAEVLSKVQKVEELQAQKMFQVALTANLIELDLSGEYYHFIHDKVRESFRDSLSEEERRAQHAKIADYFLGLKERDNHSTYRLAEHLLESDLQKYALRAFEILGKAAQMAMSEHAIPESYRYVSAASALALQNQYQLSGELLALKGYCSSLMGHHDEAIHDFEKLLQVETDPIRRAKAHYEMGRIAIFRRQIRLAWEHTTLGLNDVGCWHSNSKLLNAIRIGWQSFLGIFIEAFSLRAFFQADSERRAIFKMAAQLNEMGGVTAYFLNDPFKFFAIVTPAIYHAQKIPSEKESTFAYGVFAVACSVLGLKKIAARYMDVALARTNVQEDPYLHYRISLYKAFAWQFSNRWQEAFVLGSDLILNKEKYLDAQDFMNGAYGGISCMTLLSGHFREGKQIMDRATDYLFQLGHESLYGMGHPFLSTLIPIESSLGMISSATTRISKIQPNVHATPDDHSGNLGYYGSLLGFFFFASETGGQVDEAIAKGYQKMPSNYWLCMPHFRFFFVFECYLRLQRCLGDRNNVEFLDELKQSSKRLRRLSFFPIWQGTMAHSFIIDAHLNWFTGRTEVAMKKLEKARNLADEMNLPWVHFEVLRLMARMHAGTSIEVSQMYARQALSLARINKWMQLEKQIQKEFPLKSQQAIDEESNIWMADDRSHLATKQSRTVDHFFLICLDLILQKDPILQARGLLDQLNELFGSERAFLFLKSESGDGFPLFLGRGQNRQDVESHAQYSSKALARALETKEAAIFNEGDAFSGLGSESMLSQGLRSVLVCPLLVQDQVRGAVYVDNSVVKGLFQEEQKILLSTAANILGATLEASKAAQLEIARAHLEEDLNLAGAVQKLLLPPENRHSFSAFEIFGFSKTASRVGGDWWWTEELSDGSVLAFVGDMTGHGASSAVLTSSISGAFHLFRDLILDHGKQDQIETLLSTFLSTVDQNLSRQSQGLYAMPFTMILWKKNGNLTVWGAGQPALMYRPVGAKGWEFLPLGDQVLGDAVGKAEPIFSSKMAVEEVFVYTDGLWNLKRGRREINEKHLLEELQKFPSPQNENHLTQSLIRSIQELAVQNKLEDDVTFLWGRKLNP